MAPGGAVGALQSFGGFVIANDDAAFGVVAKGSAEFHGNVSQDTARGRDVALFDIGYGAAALFDGSKELKHVTAGCRRGVEFDGGFADVFGIFFALVKAIEVDRLGIFIERDEISAHGAGLECAFFAVDEERPWIIGVGRGAPGAMLP